MRIKERLQHIIKNSLKELNIEKKTNEINIESSKDNNSDYYTSIAISLSKELHKKPEEIAEILKNIIKDEIIEKIEVSYPGTLNIFLDKKNMFNGISEIIEKNINYGKSNIGEKRKINIDFIKKDFPQNITKEELVNAIYGDNLSRILKYNGFELAKELYINDTSEELEKVANIAKERYINICKSNNSIESNYDIKDTAKIIYSLYGDKKKDENLDYFKKEEIITSLDKLKKELDNKRINFEIYTTEKELYDKGLIDTILDKLNKKGYTYFDNDELWLNTVVNGDIKNRKLIKSDGTYTNLLPQIAYYVDKIRRKYDGIISIYNCEDKEKKIPLKPILNMLDEDINKIEIKVLPEVNIAKENKTIDDIEELRNLNINTIRYIFASKDIKELINIDLNEQELENEINYIENANVKIHKLLKNYNKKITKVNKFRTIDALKAYTILNKLYEFEDIVIKAGLNQKPHLICNYLYELITLFNEYSEKEQIITEDEEYTNEKLNLLLAIKIVINNGLNLIGIIPREDM